MRKLELFPARRLGVRKLTNVRVSRHIYVKYFAPVAISTRATATNTETKRRKNRSKLMATETDLEELRLVSEHSLS